MKITRLEDIEREKHNEKRERLTEDINKVVEGVFKKSKKDETNWIWLVGKILLFLILIMTIINLTLGNIWLLKFFWREFSIW